MYNLLFQNEFILRLTIVSIFQIWPIFYGAYFAYKLLKRAKNKSTFTLSSFFILVSLAYFLATLSTFLINTPVSYFLYIFGIYFFFFSHCFLIIISWVIVKLDEKSSYWKLRLIVIFYGILSTYVLWIGFYFNGIIYDSSTNWVPNFSLFFLIFSWTFLLTFLIIPQIYFSFKLLKVFEGVILKRRINMFIISVFLELSVVFSLFLYNNLFDNLIYRTFYLLIMPAVSTFAAFLIYKSFGKELE